MRLKPSKGTIGLLGVGVLAVVAAAGGVFYVQSDAVAQTEKRLAKKQDEVREGERVAQRMEEAIRLLEEDRKDLQYLESGVTDAAYVPTLLSQMERLATETRNKVVSVRPEVVVVAPTKLEQRRDPEAQAKGDAKKDGDKKDGDKDKKKKAPDPYTPLQIRVTLVGNYGSTQEFLRRIQQFPKIISVDTIQLHPSQLGDRSGQVGLNVEMKMVAFIMKEDHPAKPADAGKPGEPGAQPGQPGTPGAPGAPAKPGAPAAEPAKTTSTASADLGGTH